MTQRTPPSTPTRVLLKESNLNFIKKNSITTTPDPNKKRKLDEMSNSSPSESEKKTSEMMLKRLEGLESQINNLNDTIKQLNALISDLRRENSDLKELLKAKNDAKNDKHQIPPKSKQANAIANNASNGITQSIACSSGNGNNNNNNANGNSSSNGNDNNIDDSEPKMIIDDDNDRKKRSKTMKEDREFHSPSNQMMKTMILTRNETKKFH